MFAGSIILATASSIIGISLQNATGSLLDVVHSGNFSLVSPETFYLAALVTGQAFLYFCTSYLLSVAAEKIAVRLRKNLFAAIIRKDITFFDRTSTGELINSISGDVQEVRTTLKHIVSSGVRNVAQLFGGAVSIFFISKKLAILMLVVLPSMILVLFKRNFF